MELLWWELIEVLKAIRPRPQNTIELSTSFKRKAGGRVDGVVGADRGIGLQSRIGERAVRKDGKDWHGIKERLDVWTVTEPACAAAIKGPGAQPVLLHQVASAGQKAHFKEVPAIKPSFDQLLPVPLS